MTRMLVTMGIFTIQEFLQYYLGDVIGAPFVLAGIGQVADKPEQAVSFFLVLMLVWRDYQHPGGGGAFGPARAQDHGVSSRGPSWAWWPWCLSFPRFFTLAILMGVVFGLGYGAYESVDWALASDVLPSIDDYAKDMGVWHVAMVFPQVIATPIAGFLLDNFQRVVRRAAAQPGLHGDLPARGGVFCLGTVFVKQIKGVR